VTSSSGRRGGRVSGGRDPAPDDADGRPVVEDERGEHPEPGGAVLPPVRDEQLLRRVVPALRDDGAVGGGAGEGLPGPQHLADRHRRTGEPLGDVVLRVVVRAVPLPLPEPGHPGRGDEDDDEQREPLGLQGGAQHASR